MAKSRLPAGYLGSSDDELKTGLPQSCLACRLRIALAGHLAHVASSPVVLESRGGHWQTESLVT